MSDEDCPNRASHAQMKAVASVCGKRLYQRRRLSPGLEHSVEVVVAAGATEPVTE
jgi:hypothetical protein